VSCFEMKVRRWVKVNGIGVSLEFFERGFQKGSKVVIGCFMSSFSCSIDRVNSDGILRVSWMIFCEPKFLQQYIRHSNLLLLNFEQISSVIFQRKPEVCRLD
jgi:hypothetical protein